MSSLPTLFIVIIFRLFVKLLFSTSSPSSVEVPFSVGSLAF